MAHVWIQNAAYDWYRHDARNNETTMCGMKLADVIKRGRRVTTAAPDVRHTSHYVFDCARCERVARHVAQRIADMDDDQLADAELERGPGGRVRRIAE